MPPVQLAASHDSEKSQCRFLETHQITRLSSGKESQSAISGFWLSNLQKSESRRQVAPLYCCAPSHVCELEAFSSAAGVQRRTGGAGVLEAMLLSVFSVAIYCRSGCPQHRYSCGAPRVLRFSCLARFHAGHGVVEAPPQYLHISMLSKVKLLAFQGSPNRAENTKTTYRFVHGPKSVQRQRTCLDRASEGCVCSKSAVEKPCL